tara:strand:+ start:1583 stop:4399 length:2817 start_codon:yes stop_codon:yes gene_type:complete
MERLIFEEHDHEDMNILLRDLSDSENLNIVDLLKYRDHSEKINKVSNKSKKIIQQNQIRSDKYILDRDNERLDYYKNITKFEPQLLNELVYFNTDYGKQRMKLRLLKLAFDNKNKSHIINLYLQVLSNTYANKKEEKLMNKVTKYMNQLDYKKLQFSDLSNELAPLDFYNEYEKKLDSWQIDVLNLIDSKKSVLVTAPTSCGKTWLSIYPGIMGYKIIFIVPTDALVFQVASLFTKFTNKIPSIITSCITQKNNLDIIIGTPKHIEDNLPNIDNNFDIIIFDEIHNLNNVNINQYYERLLKLFSDKQILCLSATIGSPGRLISWINQFHVSNIHHVHYTTRFLNLQRQLYHNNHLNKLHPMSCLSIADINSTFLNNNLPMTPVDCVDLYDCLLEEFPECMDGYNIKDIFPEDNRRLSLNDSRIYESKLKLKLVELKDLYPLRIEKVLKQFKIDDSNKKPINLFNLFNQIKKAELIPCIVFQENTEYCKEIYITLVNYLEKLEKLNHPFYYENLEYRQSAFKKQEEELKKYKETIKINNDTINPKDIIDNKISQKTLDLNNVFIQEYKKLYHKQVNQIKMSANNDRIIKTQLLNLKKELDKYLSDPNLKWIDIFSKHPDFCLNNKNPMSADKIRHIKKSISKKLSIDVSYTNIFIQGLKRGIGIYTKHMPIVYNMIVQKMAQNGELGFVVADEELALGINMPFRSTCILGYKDSTTFQVDNYKQMIGRAGRRGKDVEGHIIFGNVDWRNLMKSELSEIVSKYVKIDNYNILSKITNNYDNTINKVNNYQMDSTYNNQTTLTDSNTNIKSYDSDVLNILLWKFREFNKHLYPFCDNLLEFEINMRIDTNYESIKKVINYIVNNLFDNNEIYRNILIDVIKYNKTNKSFINFIKINKFINIIKDFHNILLLEPNRYIHILNHLKYTFNIYKKIILNSNDLN